MHFTDVGNKNNIKIYIDGLPCEEKLATQKCRQQIREKSCQNVRKALDVFIQRATDGQRVRKRHYIEIQKHLKDCFRWTPEQKRSCASFLIAEGWNVEECLTEADVAIAAGCRPGDAVVSRDSDFFAYEQVSTIWRVVGFGSRALIHCYHVNDILVELNLTRSQLTALCIVTGNDYNRNILTLGINTNYSLIKEVQVDQGKLTLKAHHIAHKVIGHFSKCFPVWF